MGLENGIPRNGKTRREVFELAAKTTLAVAGAVTLTGCDDGMPDVVRRRMPPMPDIGKLAREINSSRETAEKILNAVNAIQTIRTKGTPLEQSSNGVSVRSETETYTVTQFQDVPYLVTVGQGEQVINQGERIPSGNDRIQLVRLDVPGVNTDDAVELREPHDIASGETIYSVSKFRYTDPETREIKEGIKIISAEVFGEVDGQIMAIVPPVNYKSIVFGGYTPTQLEHPSDIFLMCKPTNLILNAKGGFLGVATRWGTYTPDKLNIKSDQNTVAGISFTPISLTPQLPHGLTKN